MFELGAFSARDGDNKILMPKVKKQRRHCRALGRTLSDEAIQRRMSDPAWIVRNIACTGYSNCERCYKPIRDDRYNAHLKRCGKPA